MNTKETGGPAFPADMTLRDYFAAKALQGMLANPECNNTPLTQVVVDAYRTAYEMLKEREK